MQGVPLGVGHKKMSSAYRPQKNGSDSVGRRPTASTLQYWSAIRGNWDWHFRRGASSAKIVSVSARQNNVKTNPKTRRSVKSQILSWYHPSGTCTNSSHRESKQKRSNPSEIRDQD